MKFAEINKVTIDELLNVEIGAMIISKESMDKVKAILNLDGKDADELTAIRNTIVKTLSEGYIEPSIENEKNDEAMKYMTSLSGITAVIDNELFNMRALY